MTDRPLDRSHKKGLLLLNLGTPQSPAPDDVGRYLRQFLMDKWVIDIPAPLRWFFVNVLIVPKRKHASGAAYETIFTERGSPLLFHLKDLAAQVAPLLPDFEVEIGMRYGEPSVEHSLSRLKEKGVDEILVFPLYPQYAESSTRSSIEECERVAKKLGFKTPLRFVKDFFEHPGFIKAFADKIRQTIGASSPERLLLSFHGLPERHVQRTDTTGSHCLKSASCCDSMVTANRDCYRAQCYATARALTRELGLPSEKVIVSFQSRLGRTPWIRPFTDQILEELPQKGLGDVVVACPSFVADCLETIEEIGDRGRHSFLAKGGTSYRAVECPNASPLWAQGVAQIAREHLT